MQFDNDGLPIIYNTYDESSKRNIQNPIYIKDITAKEAKEKADAYVQKRENEDFKDIMYLITEAANSGKYRIYIDNECNIFVTDIIKDKLEQLGYNVEFYEITAEGKYQIVISWEGDE